MADIVFATKALVLLVVAVVLVLKLGLIQALIHDHFGPVFVVSLDALGTVGVFALADAVSGLTVDECAFFFVVNKITVVPIAIIAIIGLFFGLCIRLRFIGLFISLVGRIFFIVALVSLGLI